MRDARKNYLVVGTFLLVLLVVLVVWLAILSGGMGKTNPYHIEFQNVMGLTEGAQILYEGYPVGEIDDIVFTRKPDASFYRLDVGIRDGWQIPEDSVAVITQAGFLSAVVVDIQEGKSRRMLAPGDRIPSMGQTNILTTMSSVAGKLGDLADNGLKPLLDNLTDGTGSLQTMSKDIPVILENLKTFTVQLNDTTEHVNALLAKSGGQVDTILTEVESASENLSNLTEDFRKTGSRLDKLLVSMNTLVSNNREEINHSIADVHHTLEVVASHVQEISYNLEATTRNMNELTAEIRRNPGLILRNREFPEETGNRKK